MTETSLHERILEQKDWAIVVFLFVFALVAIVKTNFENRFHDFMRLFISDKYVKIYKDGSLIMSWFTVILFIVQMVSFAFFVQLILHFYGYVQKTDWIVFVQLFTLFTVFVLSKFLIEKIVATTFDEEDVVEQYNMLKINYRTYVGVLLMPINIFLFYNNNISIVLIYVIIGIILMINILTYLKSIKIYQNLIFGHLIYFILYLCTLEIAPYYFIYNWFSGT